MPNVVVYLPIRAERELREAGHEPARWVRSVIRDALGKDLTAPLTRLERVLTEPDQGAGNSDSPDRATSSAPGSVSTKKQKVIVQKKSVESEQKVRGCWDHRDAPKSWCPACKGEQTWQ